MAYPPAGVDHFTARAEVTIALPDGSTDTFVLAGDAEIERGTPFDSGAGRMEVPMTIRALRMRGESPLIGEVTMVEEPVGVSGYVRQLVAGQDYPAESVTFPHHAVHTGLGKFATKSEFQMRATINAIPPYGETYRLDGDPIELVPDENRSSATQVRITSVAFTVLGPP